MEKFKEILLDVWREACRNIKITESLPLIARMLVQHFPLDQILIRCIDCTHLRIDTLAVGLNGSVHQYYLSKACKKSEITTLARWHQTNAVIHHCQSKSVEALCTLILPSANGNEALVGPLGASGKLLPVLVLIAQKSQNFEGRHLEMMKILLEPFTIAIENDFRLREIIKLREAAEADKKTLLTRLSRKEIGDVIIGTTGGLSTVLERVELVAKSDVPVLLFGETGTGKELISRTIHNKSNRSEGPFIRVNCGAIPSELIDSQLFGHERGAFTGAVESRKGWFERADGGTLFLDEVGEMPLEAQVRLLRVLQDGWLERVGGKHPIKVDVRIVLATNRDLASMVAQGEFREDLWYRISTFPIYLPPLRERLEDIKSLAEHFAQRSAIRFGLPITLPTENDVHLLTAYPWPGNIRELGSVIDRAVLLGNGHGLEISRSLGWTDSFEKQRDSKNKLTTANQNNSSVAPLDEVIKKHIELVLVQTKGIIEGKNGAAALLKINPHTLRARMRKLGIRWAKFRGGVSVN